MRGKIVVRFCIAMVAIILFTIIIMFPEKQAVHAGVPAIANEQEKTAEQVKKNIQVLKGLPASQLSTVMNYMATSLGVECNHCHVIDSTGWYMDKDDKTEKRTARKMLQMVMDINKNSFGGRSEVSCYTCHRGSIEPTKLIPLPPPTANNKEEETKTAALPAVDKIMTAYENALGGIDAMKKITSRVMKGVMVDLQGKEIPIEIVQQSPDKYISSMTFREGMTNTHVFNGTNGWMTSPRGTRELPPEVGEELKKEAQLFPIKELKGLSATLHVREQSTIDGVAAYVLSSRVGQHESVRYYFDAATGLLLRKVVIAETMMGDIPQQTDFSDYRAVNGVKVPFTVKTSSVDSRDNMTHRYSSIEQNVPIDEKKFVMPQGKK